MARILIIDDVPSVLKALEYFLQNLGYEVVLAGDGRKGLELAAERFPDLHLIMLDLEMPLMNGVAVCRTLKADPLLKRIPVLMMTGVATQEARNLALNAGAAVVMMKPFDLEDLEATVARCIAGGSGSTGSTVEAPRVGA